MMIASRLPQYREWIDKLMETLNELFKHALKCRHWKHHKIGKIRTDSGRLEAINLQIQIDRQQ